MTGAEIPQSLADIVGLKVVAGECSGRSLIVKYEHQEQHPLTFTSSTEKELASTRHN
ncbi:MAG: hypothetical protein VB042_09915 [Victivallaceae bacterium]|nr:hypothetical protein [Victivallaceae bacterium]